uniref:Uncharacterized protein n=2 Tax=viral metagenome TaxID=1070528 RepID=A0A6H1ZNQ9_9ZZZZ
MSFPDTIFGKCPICGYAGDDASDAQRTDADASNSDSGNGVVLIEYQGKVMCEVCKNRLESNEQSKQSAKKHAEEDRFRSRAGFKHTAIE